MLRMLALPTLAAALIGCGGGDDARTTGEPGEVEFELGTGEAGGAVGVRATLSHEGPDRTRIVVDGLDEGEPGGGGANPVVVRGGSCDDPGEVVERLENLVGPESETSVPLGLADLLEGDYAIEVHLPDLPSGEELGENEQGSGGGGQDDDRGETEGDDPDGDDSLDDGLRESQVVACGDVPDEAPETDS